MIIELHGGVKASTGILKHEKRVEKLDLFKINKINLNAEDNNLAFAA